MSDLVYLDMSPGGIIQRVLRESGILWPFIEPNKESNLVQSGSGDKATEQAAIFACESLTTIVNSRPWMVPSANWSCTVLAGFAPGLQVPQ